jgi:cytochrome c biogenesis protein CcmG/thiol:disulfide interchange protein DsbE
LIDAEVSESQSAARPRRGALPFVVVLVVGSLLALFLYGLTTQRIQTGITPRPDTAAPDFQLATFDGKTIRLSDYRGKPVVVNFWASWCEPCKQEQTDLNQVAKRYQPRGVVFVGVDVLDTQRDALGFLRNYTIGYPVVQDATGAVYINYGVVGVPETYLVTRQGTIGQKIVGPIDPQTLAASLEVLAR